MLRPHHLECSSRSTAVDRALRFVNNHDDNVTFVVLLNDVADDGSIFLGHVDIDEPRRDVDIESGYNHIFNRSGVNVHSPQHIDNECSRCISFRDHDIPTKKSI